MSKCALLPYEDYMIVATLTEVGMTQSGSLEDHVETSDGSQPPQAEAEVEAVGDHAAPATASPQRAEEQSTEAMLSLAQLPAEA
ncbi:MAG: hypothetical protein P4L40_01680 [Terracidiphilus sp.]|nr:hypothetical protein [Terracidiphilus sp.]